MKVRVYSSVEHPEDPFGSITIEGEEPVVSIAVAGFVREDGVHASDMPEFFLTFERLVQWIEAATVWRVEVL